MRDVATSYTHYMPAKTPRVSGLELREAAGLLEIAEERARTFDETTALFHDDVFGSAKHRNT